MTICEAVNVDFEVHPRIQFLFPTAYESAPAVQQMLQY